MALVEPGEKMLIPYLGGGPDDASPEQGRHDWMPRG
jgi:hypothetical protein